MKVIECVKLYLFTFVIIGKFILRVENYPIIYVLLYILYYIVLFFIYVKYLHNLRLLFNPFMYSFIVIWGYLMCRTMLHSYQTTRFLLILLLSIIAIYLLYGHKIKFAPAKCFGIFSNVFFSFYVLNFIQMMIFPNQFINSEGDIGYIITANHNQLGGIFIPGLLSTLIAAQFDSSYYKRFLLMWLLTFFMVLYSGSMTSTVCFLFIIFFYVYRKNNFLSKCSVVGLIYITIFFFIDVVITSFTYNITFDGFIQDFLNFIGKDETFSGRTNLWRLTSLVYIDNPIWGIGYYDKEWAELTLNNLPNTHNIILEFLLQGGILLCVLLVIFIYNLVKKVIKLATIESRYALFLMVVLLFMMQLEVYSYLMITLSFLFLYFMIESSKAMNKFNG